MKNQSDQSESFGHRLRRLRVYHRFSIKEMASKLCVAIGTYREWENGRAIQGEPYSKIAQVFGISLYELLEGQKPDHEEAQKLLILIEDHVRKLRRELDIILLTR